MEGGHPKQKGRKDAEEPRHAQEQRDCGQSGGRMVWGSSERKPELDYAGP